MPEIIIHALQELFWNQNQQLRLDTMDGVNRMVNEIIQDCINQSKEGFTENIAKSSIEQLN